MNDFFELTIDELNSLIKQMRKADKIIKSSDYLNKWYQSGHIKLFSKGRFVMVDVIRWNGSDDMERSTKDYIISYLRKNNFLYYEQIGCYIWKDSQKINL